MTMANNQPATVMKAFTWAYEELALSCEEASQYLGISEHALHQTALVGFDLGSEESKLQLAFIRLYHLLYTLSDGDSDVMVGWFNQFNPQLGGVPKVVCRTLKGIRCVSDYLNNAGSLHTSAPLHCEQLRGFDPSGSVTAQS